MMQWAVLKKLGVLFLCSFLCGCASNINLKQERPDRSTQYEPEEVISDPASTGIPPLKRNAKWYGDSSEGNRLWLVDMRKSLDDLTRKLSNKPVIKIYNVTRNDVGGEEINIPVVKVRFSGMVFFDSGSFKLKAESRSVLNAFARKVLKDYPDTKILLLGHTDSVGKAKKNKELSEKRALSVMEELHKRGVLLEVMKTLPIGEMRPIESNQTKKGRAMNRRVEFLLSSNEQANREVVVDDKEFCSGCIDDHNRKPELTAEEVEKEVAGLEAVTLADISAKSKERDDIVSDSSAVIRNHEETVANKVIKSCLDGVKIIQDR